ncbi:MAG TPA: pilus assembly protein TadG-related protein, partial [Terriglobales bacterium]|nr:pilus assembly protein TadG-related protein [Terriglobales bacterium]
MKNNRQHPRDRQRGSTLVLAAAALLMLLGMAGFAIDALTLYVSRTDAQRAADAAALAGAKIFVTSGCTTAANCTTGSTQTLVKQAAEGAGAQNKVFGQYASIADSDITFPPSPTGDLHDPMVQVKVHRVIPTLFMGALSRMLGGNVSGITVAATATAEAFNPTGSNLPFGTGCIKPWLMPNCD